MDKAKFHSKSRNNSDKLIIPSFVAQIQAVDEEYWKIRVAKYADFDKLETSPYIESSSPKTTTSTEEKPI